MAQVYESPAPEIVMRLAILKREMERAGEGNPHVSPQIVLEMLRRNYDRPLDEHRVTFHCIELSQLPGMLGLLETGMAGLGPDGQGPYERVFRLAADVDVNDPIGYSNKVLKKRGIDTVFY